MADPSTLFDSAAYVATGAVLWPDYWASSAAPDLQRILPSVSLPTNTFESGQMVLNKQRLDTLKGVDLHGLKRLWQRQYAGISDTVMLVHHNVALQHYLRQEAAAAYVWSSKRSHLNVNSHVSMMIPMPEAHCTCWHSSATHIRFVVKRLLATSVCVAAHATLHFAILP